MKILWRMRNSLLFFCLLWGYGCTSPSQPQISSVSSEPVTAMQKLPCEDPDWGRDDTIFRSPEPAFIYLPSLPEFGFSQKIKLKNGFLGIIAHSGQDEDEQAIAVYQTDSLGQWRQIHCGPLEGAIYYDTKRPDLNFDGYKDLLIVGNDGGIRYNHFSVAFLYDARRQTFRRDTTLDLPNLTIDTRHKQLRARHYGSRYGACIKWLYGWEGDSLVLLAEAIYHTDLEATIRLQERQKDGSTKYDTLRGKPEPLWEFFKRQAVWKGNWDTHPEKVGIRD